MSSIVFWASALALVYTFAAYPLLLACWARVGARPVRRAPIEPRVAIIVVVRNEQARIQAKIVTCLAQDYRADHLRLLVVSDGSHDHTNDIVTACADPRVQLLAFAEQRGKAACLNDAVAACDEELLVFTDARQALSANAVRVLVENFADAGVGAVSGELVLVDDGMSNFAQGVDAYWRYEKFIRQREALVHSAPGVTGALYAMRRACYKPIPTATILDDVAIPMQAVLAGWRVVFDTRALAYDKPSQTAAQEKLRKVRTLAGNYQLLAMMPGLLLPIVNPIFLQFFSHKVMRLLAPLAMLALLVSNAGFAAQSQAWAVVMGLHIAAYVLALVAQRSASLARWRVAKLGAAFLALNWYAVLGLWQFLRGRQAQLWHTQRPAAVDDNKTKV